MATVPTIGKTYVGGIMRRHCTYQEVNHAVQAVGYGKEVVDGVTVPYWVVRNSWGPDWGESGYLRIFMGENVCGIGRQPAFVIAKPGA